MKISANGAQVILAAGTLCTAQIALNSSLQRYNNLVRKGLMDHTVYATRFAMELPSGDPCAPLLLQTMIHINKTTALLMFTINNSFFPAGSLNVPIHQYLGTDDPRPGEFQLIEMKNGEAKFNDHIRWFDTVAVLLEYGAPSENRNLVVKSGTPHPVIRLRHEYTYHDVESLINMQTLARRIRNAVAKCTISSRLEKLKEQLRRELKRLTVVLEEPERRLGRLERELERVTRELEGERVGSERERLERMIVEVRPEIEGSRSEIEGLKSGIEEARSRIEKLGIGVIISSISEAVSTVTVPKGRIRGT